MNNANRRDIPIELRRDVERFIADGVMHRNVVGWIRTVKAPAKRDLPLFVRTVAHLGTWSVTVGPLLAPVEMSTGTLPSEVLFRLPECHSARESPSGRQE